MTTCLSDLVTDLMDIAGDTLTAGTVDSGSTTTVVDAARTESDDEWINAHILVDDTTDDAAPKGEERRITDFVASSDTLTVFPAFTAATAANDTYEIREVFSYGQYKKAVNHSIRMASEWWPYITTTYPIAAAAETGTDTSSDARSISDSSQSWTDDEHIGRQVFIYDGTGQGQWRFIIDNDTDTLVVPEWDTTPDTTSKFVIEKTGAAHIVICSSQVDYPLPGGCTHIYEAWIELPDVEESGTATAATTTTLTDSGQSWTADEHIGRYIVIYDGTGRGQTRLITDNTTTAVTVGTWSITPDTTSKYKIKEPTELTSDVYEQSQPWSRIYNAYIDIAGGFIRLPGQHTEGAWVRLKYETAPSELTATSDVTDVPEEYILLEGEAWLWRRKIGKVDNARARYEIARREAEGYAVTHRRRRPYGTLWQWDDEEQWQHPWDSPFRGT